jgi:genome maintenance exonuclease 1
MEHYIQNKVCDKKIMPDAASMVKQMRAVADAYIDNVRAVEIQLCSEMMGVAGTIDLVADYEGEIAIIDWKTSLRPKNPDWITDYFLQKAAYAVMWRECTGIKVDKLVTLVSVLEGQPQVFLNDKNTWIHDFQDRLKAFNLAHPSASYAVPVTH